MSGGRTARANPNNARAVARPNNACASTRNNVCASTRAASVYGAGKLPPAE
ncbi:MAG TPA: hypothetical protein VHZ03_35595 [Trebonia sp.]|jgi:hypothetical protein|nr:hypothetical protein [Trebonia sp.]